MRILIVDDFATMRRIIKSILNQLGFDDFEQAEDGLKALNILKKDPNFDLVVTDWNMPLMNGLELLREIRKSEDLKKIPVLMVTAEAKREQIFEAAKSGVNGYIVKPFNKDMLERKIEKIFQREIAKQKNNEY